MYSGSECVRRSFCSSNLFRCDKVIKGDLDISWYSFTLRFLAMGVECGRSKGSSTAALGCSGVSDLNCDPDLLAASFARAVDCLSR